MKKNNGITLIALVITIVVLIILAGVAINLTLGNNGIFKKAEHAKEETTIGQEKEQISLAYSSAVVDKMEENYSSVTAEEIQEELNNLNANAEAIQENSIIKVTFNKTGNIYTIDSEGNILWQMSSGGEEAPSVLEALSVGEYVSYDPTKANAAKTQDLDEETQTKLTYVSPTGTIPSSSSNKITHGNGYGPQTYTAKPLSQLKWKVLSVSEDKVEIIPETVILKDDTTDNSGNFVIKGGIGYLFVEQELNEICKIYGYGYGADTSVTTTYAVGGPQDTSTAGTITGSGARSLTIEYLNKLAGITENDFKTLNSNYGSTTYPTLQIYYPTLNSTNTTYPGQSTSRKTSFMWTLYGWNKSKITDTEIQNMIFNGNYWIASRCVQTGEGYAAFYIRAVAGDNLSGAYPCGGNNPYLSQYAKTDYAVRPVVTLNSDAIDTTTDYEKVGSWNLK